MLKENSSPAAEFNVDYITAFSVIIKEPYEGLIPSIQQLATQLASSLPEKAKSLIVNIKHSKMSASELQLAFSLSPKSKFYFKKQFILPNLEAGLIAMTHPDNPRHPQQKYYLSELGLSVLKLLQEDNKQ